MAFTGVAVIKQVADNVVRITGLSLAGGASGTVSLAVGTGAVKCPAGVQFQEYTAGGATVGAQDAIDVTAKIADAGAPSAVGVSVVKTGDTAAAFLATLTNQNAASSTANLEILVKIHT